MPSAAVITRASPPVRCRARSGPRPRHELATLCAALEVQIVPVSRRPRDNETTAKATLRDILAEHGEQHFIMTVRTILESEGNTRAMVAPIIHAVSDVMLSFPTWPNTGLDWLEAFDVIDLLSLLRLARPLCTVAGMKARAVIAGMLVQLLHPRFG
jgi:hypothetical protein